MTVVCGNGVKTERLIEERAKDDFQRIHSVESTGESSARKHAINP